MLQIIRETRTLTIMNKLIFTGLLLFSFQLAYCQIESYTTSRGFDRVSFAELVQITESESQITFYYNNEWTEDVFLSIDHHSSLLPQLRKQLLQKGVSLYIEGNGIILIKGPELVTKLPAFNSNESTVRSNQKENEITVTEKSYLESKKIASTEVLVIGDESRTVPGQTCSVKGKIRDVASGEPVIGATVYVEEIHYGTVTDLDGNFQMNLKTGQYEVQITHISMKQLEYHFQVYSSGSVSIEMHRGAQGIRRSGGFSQS